MLESWSISRRVAAGFVLMTILVVGLAVFSQRSVSTLGGGYFEYRNISAQASAAAAYMEDMFEARLASFKYRYAPNEQDRTAVLDNLAEISDDQALYASFQDDADRRVRVDDIRAQATEYATAFNRMAADLQAALQIREDYNLRSDALKEQINGIFTGAVQTGGPAVVSAAGRSLQDLLSAIVVSKQYFAGEDALFDQTQEMLAAFERSLQQLERLNQQDSIARQIAELRQTYAGYFDMLVSYRTLYDDAREIQRGTLDRIGPAVEQALDDLGTEIVDRQNILGPEGATIVDRLLLVIPVVGVVATLMAIVTALVIGRWIGGSVGRLAETTDKLAAGDNDVAITGTEHRHELGRMARALNVFKEAQLERQAASAERQRLRAEQDAVVSTMKQRLADLASGDLETLISASFAPDYEDLRINYNAAVTALDQAISDVAATALRIAATTEASQTATIDLSQRTENQAATLEQTAAALDELTASVRSAAEHAKSVDASVNKARDEAKRNGEVVSQAVSAMGEIEQSSSQIARVIGVIDDIAFQTNLLALNAGVEAARAGESGKGFAVVASEVRALAQRSAEAAKEISALIANSSRHVQQGTALVGNAGEALSEIITQVNDIADMTSQIASSAEEQAIGLSEINIGVNQLDQVTQQNAAMVQESLSRGEDLTSETGRLGGLMNKFRVSDAALMAPRETAGADQLTSAIASTTQKEPAPSGYRDAGKGSGAAKATGTDNTAFWEDF